VDRGVCPQDLLAQSAGTTVDDEDEVAGRERETVRVVGLEDGFDPGQFDEVVAATDRPEALDVAGGNAPESLHNGPGRVIGIVFRVQCVVEVREQGGELRWFGPLEFDGEHRDAAADVRAHQERVQHRRRHRSADRGALAGVQIRHGGDVEHADGNRFSFVRTLEALFAANRMAALGPWAVVAGNPPRYCPPTRESQPKAGAR
jgi:hypothetical protein